MNTKSRLMALLLCGSLLAVPAVAAESATSDEFTARYPNGVKPAGSGIKLQQTKDGCFSAAEAKAAGEQLDLGSVSIAGLVDWDSSQWWASRDSVKYAIGRGYVNGRKVDGGAEFAGSSPVTHNEFAAVLVRMCVKPENIEACRKEALAQWARFKGLDASKPETDKRFRETEHWMVAAGYVQAAEKYTIESVTMLGEGGDKPCTRQEMARLICNALRVRGEDNRAINGLEAVKALTDYGSIMSGRRNDVGIAVGYGIIAGDNAGQFKASETMDRASMCEIIYRLDNPKMSDGMTPRDKVINNMFGDRSQVPNDPAYDVNDPTHEVSKAMRESGIETDLRIIEPITIDMRTPEVGHRCPYAGDTVIRPDGTSVVLEFDEKYGILGWGQNCDPWTGTISGYDGHLYGIGEWGGDGDMRAARDKDYYEFKAQDHLMLCLVGGEATKWEAHWSNEFELVKADIWAKVLSGEIPAPTYEGQVEAGGLLKAYKRAGRGLQWVYMEHHKDG